MQSVRNVFSAEMKVQDGICVYRCAGVDGFKITQYEYCGSFIPSPLSPYLVQNGHIGVPGELIGLRQKRSWSELLP